MDKLIVTAALTGAGVIPSQTPYLPITPEQIATEAVKAADAGAAVVHIHARNPENGRPTPDTKVFKDIASRIKKQSDVVICFTTGGGPGMTAEERIALVGELKPEMASLNMGSMNFTLEPILRTIQSFKHDWEKSYLEGTNDIVFKNSFRDIEIFVKRMYQNQTVPELEIYDTGHLYNTAFMLRENILTYPLHMQYVMGVLGGIGSTAEDFLHFRRTSDRLFKDYTWSVIGIGRAEFTLGAMAIPLGGHVRVGIEDNIFLEKGVLAKSNAELVSKIVRIAKDLGRDIATPDEARRILHLKGKDKTNF